MGHVTEDTNGTSCATSLHIIKYEDWTQHHHNYNTNHKHP